MSGPKQSLMLNQRHCHVMSLEVFPALNVISDWLSRSDLADHIASPHGNVKVRSGGSMPGETQPWEFCYAIGVMKI